MSFFKYSDCIFYFYCNPSRLQCTLLCTVWHMLIVEGSQMKVIYEFKIVFYKRENTRTKVLKGIICFSIHYYQILRVRSETYLI